MQQQYFIDVNGDQQGPFDLIDIMRNIRHGGITADTQISLLGMQELRPARDIPEIAVFFEQSAAVENAPRLPDYKRLIANGWRFTMEHNAITVFSGCLLLLVIMLEIGLVKKLGLVTGSIATFCIAVFLHHLFLLFALRLYRARPAGVTFIEQDILPISGSFTMSCMVLALMMSGGFLLVPLTMIVVYVMVPNLLGIVMPLMIAVGLLALILSVAIAILYLFVPFVLLDYDYGMVESMQASRLLLKKSGRGGIGTISILVVLHVLGMLLIIPVPLTLPIFACCLAEIYDHIVAS